MLARPDPSAPPRAHTVAAAVPGAGHCGDVAAAICHTCGGAGSAERTPGNRGDRRPAARVVSTAQMSALPPDAGASAPPDKSGRPARGGLLCV